MKLFGSITELVAAVFRKNSQAVTLRPNQATTYTADRDIQFPPGDAAHVLASADSTQTVTNKTISGSSNTLTVLAGTQLSGQTPIANGGTGQTTAAAAYAALSPLTTKGDVSTYSTTTARLAVGTNGQVLTADSAQATGLTWTSPLTNPMTTEGDIIVGGTSGAATRLAIGASGTVLKGGTTPSYSTIVNGDVSASAAIAYSKLNLATSIVNADINGSAAIAGSKIVEASASVAGVIASAGNSQSLGPVLSMPNHPAFHAYKSANQNFTTAAVSTLTVQTEEFDQTGAYNASERFTPARTGVYMLTGTARITAIGTGTTDVVLMLYKNGSLYKTLGKTKTPSGMTDFVLSGGCVANVTSITDFFELTAQFVGLSSGTATIAGGIDNTFFSACKIA